MDPIERRKQNISAMVEMNARTLAELKELRKSLHGKELAIRRDEERLRDREAELEDRSNRLDTRERRLRSAEATVAVRERALAEREQLLPLEEEKISTALRDVKQELLRLRRLGYDEER